LSDKFYSFKTIMWLLYFGCVFTTQVNANSDEKRITKYHGESVGDAKWFDLDFQGSDQVLIRVNQSSADYKVSVYKKGQEEPLKEIDFSSYLGFDELVIVKQDQCRECEIKLQGVDYIDRVSPFLMSIESLPSSIPNSALQALSKITHAGELNQAASLLDDEQANTNDLQELKVERLKRVANELAIVSTLNLPAEWEWLQHHAMSLQAYTLYYAEQPKSARGLLNKLLTLTGKTIYRIQALYELASTYEENERDIIRLYTEGLRLANILDHKRAIAQGLNYHAINDVWASKYQQAFQHLSQAKQIYEKEGNVKGLLYIYTNLAWGNLRAGNVDTAIYYATQLKVSSEDFKYDEGILWGLYNLALSYSDYGDTNASDKFLDQALFRVEQLVTKKKASFTRLHSFLNEEKANLYLRLGLIELARDYASKAKNIIEAESPNRRIAELESLLADIELEAHNFESAKAQFINVLDDDLQSKRVPRVVLQALKLLKIALAQEDWVLVTKYLKIVTSTLGDVKDQRVISESILTILKVLERLDMRAEATELVTSAQGFYRQEGMRIPRIDFLLQSAILAEDIGDLDQALTLLSEAEFLLNELLDSISKPQSRRTWLATNKDIFESQIRSTLKQSKSSAKETLEIVERFRARTLVEQINQLNLFASSNHQLEQEREKLFSKLVENASELHFGNFRDTTEVLREARKLGEQLQKIESNLSLERTVKLEKQKTTTSHGNMSFDEQEAIISFFIGERNSWAWVTNSNDVRVFELPKKSELEPIVESYLKSISTPPASSQTMGAWDRNRVIAKLADVLEQPLAFLASNQNTQKLTVIADGLLSGITLAPIPINSLRETLHERFLLSYAPSIATKRAIVRNSQKHLELSRPKTLLVSVTESNENSGNLLQDLSFARTEAKTIESVLSASVTHLQEHEASKANIENHLRKDFDILHISSHGLISYKQPTLSGLVISSKTGENRMWLAPEISHTSQSLGLVVLSSCESSRGSFIDGEGAMSISRAFLEGGARQVLGTLWKVQDESTLYLMRSFYQALVHKKMSVEDSLRYAQSKVAHNEERDWSDPYYWAGFLLTGA